MPGSTSLLSLPFPVAADYIAQGASMIQQLAEAVESHMVIASGSKTADALPQDWPEGVTVMYITTAQAATGNWPESNVGAMILTLGIAGSSPTPVGAAQYWHRYQRTRPGIKFRIGSATNGWGPWITVADGEGTPRAMASGRTSITPPAGGGTASATVFFPTGRFVGGDVAGPIRMSASVATSTPQTTSVGFSAATPSGVTVYLYRSNVVGTGVDWIATQGLEPINTV